MAVRRKAAEERQAAYDKLTLEQKLAKLPPEPHAAKQRAKLLKQLEAKQSKAPEVHRHPTPEEFGVDPKELAKKNKELIKSMKKSKKEGKQMKYEVESSD